MKNIFAFLMAGIIGVCPLNKAYWEPPKLKKSEIIEHKDYGSKKCVYYLRDINHNDNWVRASLTYCIDELIKKRNVRLSGIEGLEKELAFEEEPNQLINIEKIPIKYLKMKAEELDIENQEMNTLPHLMLEAIHANKLFTVGVDDSIIVEKYGAKLDKLLNKMDKLCDKYDKGEMRLESFNSELNSSKIELDSLMSVLIHGRDAIIVTNLIKNMNEQKIDTAALTFGSAHENGIKRKLNEMKISYFILEPTNPEYKKAKKIMKAEEMDTTLLYQTIE